MRLDYEANKWFCRLNTIEANAFLNLFAFSPEGFHNEAKVRNLKATVNITKLIGQGFADYYSANQGPQWWKDKRALRDGIVKMVDRRGGRSEGRQANRSASGRWRAPTIGVEAVSMHEAEVGTEDSRGWRSHITG